jgi:hypothetical protein
MQYLIVVPFLTEVDRWKEEACIPLEVAPDGIANKSDWLRDTVKDGASIVCTHTLFDLVDLSRTDLSEYDLIIDEVFDCVEAVHGISESAFDRVYVGDGYATVDKITGRVTPTQKWIELAEKVAPTIRLDLFRRAKQGSLYKVDGQGFFVSLVPVELFTSPRSCTVLTYLAEGSIMAGYLKRLGIRFVIDKEEDSCFKSRLIQRLEVKDIPALRDVQMTFTAQDRMKDKGAKKVSQSLKNLRSRELAGVQQDHIILSCNREKWLDSNDRPKGPFALDSRLAKVHWLSRTTRGTNRYRHCSHAIYLNDLRLNPSVKEWLGWTKDEEDAWALSELVQWMMRTRLREGEIVSLYLASPRMKALLDGWLSSSEVLLLAA